jgi:ABC-type Fe3+-hydroxamate transport system substrate-binding protein
VGRITGRGNTANLEVVLALKPDLIPDVGSVNPTYVSLADRVQQQTGIPYPLLDGRFDGISLGYRTLGDLIGDASRGGRSRAIPKARSRPPRNASAASLESGPRRHDTT